MRTATGLVLLGLAAFGLRAGLTVALAVRHEGPLTYEHGEIAENLLAGRGFSVTFLGQSGPTSQQAPLYPALLAGLYRCFGAGSDRAILAMQLLQSAAGAGLVLAVVWLAWSLMPREPAIGWIAGIGAAVYPTHVYMVTHIQVVVWAALVLAILVAVVASIRGRHSRVRAVAAGVLGGVLLLLDPILVLAMPILAFALWQAARSRNGDSQSAIGFPRSLGQPLTFLLVAALVIAPWLLRNYRVHGEFVFVKSTFGYALWQGNNPVSWGTDKVPKSSAAALRQDHDGTLAGIDRAMWEARHETLYIDDVLLKPSGYREFVGLSEPARSRLLGQRAWRFIRDEPASYGRLCAQRLRYFLLWDETNPKAANPVYRGTTLIWLALAAFGLWMGRQHLRSIWPTLAIFAAVALFHTLTIVSARFRVPVEPLTFVWCAFGVNALAGRRWRRVRSDMPAQLQSCPSVAREELIPPARSPAAARFLPGRPE
jgi:hypothetical protein